ncbi:MAG: transposase [Synergistaceae bacterium]|nr:transposase [Synergistaceae bacterium]
MGYHLIWCPKCRRMVLVGSVDARLKELFRKALIYHYKKILDK